MSVCVCGGGVYYTPLPQASSITIHAKTTVHCSPDFSMVSPLFGLSNLICTYMYRTFTPTVSYLFLSLFIKVLQSGPALYYSVEIILYLIRYQSFIKCLFEYILFIHAFLSIFSYSNFTIDHISHLIWNGYWMGGFSIELVGEHTSAPSPLSTMHSYL